MATIQIADNDARKQYTQAVTANSTQLVIDFPFFSLDDIEVIVTSAAGLDTTLTRGTGAGTFAVVGTAVDDGFSGGYITLGDTYSDAATKFTIFRDIPIARTTDFPTSGPFNVSSLNTQLDKIFAIEQELETQITRSFKLPESDSGTAVLPNVSSRSNKYLAFDSNGNPIASDGTVNATPINSAMQPFVQSSNVTDARALLLAGSNLTIPTGGFNTTIQSTGDINLTAGTNDQVIVNTDGTRSFLAGNVKIEDNLISAANGQGELRLEPNGAGPLLINGDATVTEDSSTGTILSVHGTSTQGMMELVSDASASADSKVGKVQFNMKNNDATFKSCAEVAVIIDGATNGRKGGNLLFRTRDNNSTTMADRMRILRTGEVRMNTTSPFNSNMGVNPVLHIDVNSVSSTFNGGISIGGLASGETAFSTMAGASVDYSAAIFANGGATTVGSISCTTSSTTYATSSDYRLKENVIDMTGAIDRVKQLAPKRFNFIAEPSKTVDGFLAHEAQAVVPESVIGTKDAVDGDGNPVIQGIDQAKLVPLLCASLQEAITKIEALEARVTTLENA